MAKGKTHILIVDDEELIRSTLKEILENEGYKTSEAGNGEEAVNLLKTGTYDCVLLDIKMPKVDGLEVLEKCGDIAIHTPFIKISEHGNEDTS